MRHVDSPSARPGLLGARGLGVRRLGVRLVSRRLGIRRLGVSRVGLRRLSRRSLSLSGLSVGGLGVGGLGVGGLGVRRPGVAGRGLCGRGIRRLGVAGLGLGRRGPSGLGFRRLSLGSLGSRFRDRLSPPVAGAVFLTRLLQRDLLLDGLLLAHRFLVSPFLAGGLAICGPRRDGPVPSWLSRRAGRRLAQPEWRLWRPRLRDIRGTGR